MIETRMNDRSMRLLFDAMKAAEKKTTWAAEKSAAKAMHFVCRSGAAGVKPRSMRAKRELVTNPNRTGRGRRAKGAKFAIKVLRQSGKTFMLPTNSKSDRRRKIARLGLAATAFRVASGVFGASISGEKVKSKSRIAKATLRKTKNTAQAIVEIFLSYIETAFPRIIPQALKKGLTVFIRQFDRDWATALKEEGLS